VDLQARVRFLGRLGNAAPIGLVAIDRDLRVLAANDVMARVSALPVDAQVGRTLREVMPSAADQIESAAREVFETGEPVSGIELQDRDPLTGSLRWAEASCFPVVDDDTVIAVGCAVLDTTDRITALRRLLLLQDAVNAVAAAPEPLTAIQEVTERARSALGAQGAAAGIASDDGRRLEVVAVAGRLGDLLRTQYPRVALDAHTPASVAFHERRVVWVPTRDEWSREYPDGSHLVQHGASAVLTVPLEGARTNRCLGVLAMLWEHEPELSSSEIALVATFAQQATEALDRIMLLDAERHAREQFEMLARLGDRVDAQIGLDARVRAFFELIIPEFADIALVELQGDPESDEPPMVYVRHVDPEHEGLVRRFRELRRSSTTPLTLTGVIASGKPQFLGAQLVADTEPVDEETIAVAEALGIGSSALLPLVARGHVFGGVAVGRRRGRAPFSDADFALATELVRRLAVALENARLYERERQIAATLQHSLLPERVPDIPGIRCWARYLPGTDLAVGGDFWDVIPLSAGRVLLVVGDVAGRGERAAITMGRLRTVLRASARQERSPSALAGVLNRFLVEDEHEMATCVCGILDPAEHTLRIASAGHLPILKVDAHGDAALVGGATGLPLGVRAYSSYTDDVIDVTPGDSLVLFTDGLVERRETSIDARFAQLVDVAAAAVRSGSETWCDRIVDEMIGARRSDDVAVLGVRLASGPQTFSTRVPAELARLRDLRDRFRAWLAANRVDHESVEALCLAVGEATANAAMHAYGPQGGDVRVRGSIDAEVVRVRVEDDGHWRPSPDQLGRGLRIIEQLAHEMHIDRRSDGTTVEIVRRLAPS
jgi:GAF domain-containing protein/anti-sigma regulatory factor (Ser/Thr protein kinase)